MEDLFKKFLYTGVGLVSITADKMQELVKQFIDEDKLTREEGRKIVNEIVEKTAAKREEFEVVLKKAADELSDKMKFSSNAGEVEELTKRLEALEAKLGLTPTAKTVNAMVNKNKGGILAKAAKNLDKTFGEVVETGKEMVEGIKDVVTTKGSEIKNEVAEGYDRITKDVKTETNKVEKAIVRKRAKAEKALDQVAAVGKKEMDKAASKTKTTRSKVLNKVEEANA